MQVELHNSEPLIPLGLVVCYWCEDLLWSIVDGGHMVDEPSGMSENEVPASAYNYNFASCT